MIIYILTFILSIIFISVALYLKKQDKVILYKINLIIGLLIPVIIAGLRNIEVGFDTHVYVYGLFEKATIFSNPIDYIKSMDSFWQINDVAYLLLTFIFTKVFNNFNFLLFIIELLVILPVYKSITNYTNNRKTIIIAMILFYLFWYNVSLNMVRQSLALSFSLLSISYLSKDKPKLSLLYNMIAIGFHKTALITIIINILFYLFKNEKISEKNKNKLSYSIIIMSFLLVIIFYLFVFMMKHDYTFLQKLIGNFHYFAYFENFKFDFSFIDTVIYGYIFLVFILCDKNNFKEKFNYKFFKTLSLSNLIVLQIGAIIPYGERLSFYLLYPLLINILPMLISDGKTKKTKLLTLMTMVVFIAYWFIIFCFLNIHNTVPYKFY